MNANSKNYKYFDSPIPNAIFSHPSNIGVTHDENDVEDDDEERIRRQISDILSTQTRTQKGRGDDGGSFLIVHLGHFWVKNARFGKNIKIALSSRILASHP